MLLVYSRNHCWCAKHGIWLESLFTSSYEDTVYWALWKSRNALFWNHKSSSINDVVVSASVTLDQWKKAQRATSLSSFNICSKDDGAEIWTKTVANTIQVNVDAAIFENESLFGYGIVVRSDT
uniref:Uncharacterized protein n=1 Tax=Cannabis sativa TaxID=3483 RepID=A0A803NMY5_CANSA